MMKIAVDVDGVLLDIITPYTKLYNQQFNASFKKEDVKKWEFYLDWNLTEEEAFKIFYKIYNNAISVSLIDRQAPKYLQLLNQEHDIDIVSARSFKFKSQLKEKLEQCGITKGIHYKRLVLVESKPYDLKLQYKYDIYVDDNPHLVEPIKNNERPILLLFDQPWNLDSVCNEKAIRVKNWEEVYDQIKNLTDFPF